MAQPGVFGFVAVVVAWLALHAPGLGAHGLWDPWEMDRAYVARRMIEPPRVLVIERGEDGLGPIAQRVKAEPGVDVVVPDVHDAARPTPARLLDRATELLDREVHHLALLDLGPHVRDPGSTTEVEALAGWLARAAARNPTTEFVLLAPTPKPGDPVPTVEAYAERLAATWREVRLELAARELDGGNVGRTGGFRTELTRVLKAAREQGYDALGRGQAADEGMLERGLRRAAEARDLARRLAPGVPAAVAANLGDAAAFALPARVLEWPTAAGPEAQEAANASIETVMVRVRGTLGRPWQRAELKRDGQTVSGPPLDAWLMALSFSRLGVNELAARLPFYLLGLLALIAFFASARTAFGPGVATLGSLVLATTPLFYAAARSTAGALSATASLTFVAAGLMGVAARGGLTIGATWLVAVGSAGLLYSQGVVGLGVAALLAVLAPWVGGERRVTVWLPGLILTGLVGWLVWEAVGERLPAEFGPGLPLLSWDLRMEDRPVFLNYDDMLKQIGFGALPWAPLLPLAIGVIATRTEPAEQTRPGVLVLLWLVVPFAVFGAAQKWTNHLVYPAIPAAALAVGFYLHQVFTGQRRVTALEATVFALITVVLINDLRKSAEPATSFLTADPPLAGIKEESDYPEAVKLPSLLTAMLLGVIALIFAHGARALPRLRVISEALTRPVGLAGAGFVALGGLATWWLISLQGQIAEVFLTPGGQILEPIHRLYVRDVFYWRPHHWALLIVVAVALCVAAQRARLVARCAGWVRSWAFTPLIGNTIAHALAWSAALADRAAPLPAVAWTLPVIFGLARGAYARPARLGVFALAATLGLFGSQAPLALGLAALVVGLSLLPETGFWPLARLLARAACTAVVALLTESPVIAMLASAACIADVISLRRAPPLDLPGHLDGLAAVASLTAPAVLTLAPPTLLGAALVAVFAGLSLAPWLAAGGWGPSAGTLPPKSRWLRLLVVVVAFSAPALAASQWLLCLGPLVAALWGYAAALGSELADRLRKPVDRLLSVYRDGGPRFHLAHAALAVILALAAFVLTLVFGTFEAGSVVSLTVASPWFAGCVAAGVALVAARSVTSRLARERLDGAGGLGRLFGRVARDRTACAALWLLAALFAGLAAQLFLDSGLTRARFLALPLPLPDGALAAFRQGQAVSACLAAVGLLAALAALPRLRSGTLSPWALAGGAAAALVALMVVAMSRKWLQLESLADPADAGYLTYVFARSRVTLALYGLAVLLTAGAAIRYRGSLARLAPATAQGRELIVVGLALVLAAAAGLVLGAPRAPTGLLGALGAVLAGAPLLPTLLHSATSRRLVLGHRGLLTAALALLGAALVAVGLSGRPAALAAVPIGLGLAAWFWPRPLTAAGSIPSTGAAFLRGLLEISVASLAFAVPAALGADEPAAAVWAGLTAWGALVVAHGLFVGFRIGLGVADLIGRLSVGAPSSLLFAGLGIALCASGGGEPRVVLVAAGAALLLLAAVLALSGLEGGVLGAVARVVERPPAFVVTLVALALSISVVLDGRLVAALSLHVSQKHLLDSIREREGGELPEGRVFQHSLSGQNARNFYTASVPEIRDSSAALRVLQGGRDEVVTLSRAGVSLGESTVLQGFAPAADANGDGVRDEPAAAGVYSALDLQSTPAVLTDPERAWQPGQWAGAVLVDSDGWRYSIVDNTPTTLKFELASARAPEDLTAKAEKRAGPPFDPTIGVRNAYRIVASDKLEVTATALTRDRRYFLLPKTGAENPGRSDRGSFSTLNFEYRRLTGGLHIPVLDDRSSRILLASTWLGPDDIDKNPIRSALITEEEMVRRLASGEARGAPAKAPLSHMVTWEESVALVGYGVEPWVVQRGRKFTLRLYFQALKPMKESNKLFVHADRGSSRIHTDHWPNAVSQGKEGKHCVGCFQTDHWMAGDIIVDTYEREVPFGSPAGETELFLGFFNPDDNDKRVPVSSWNDKLVRHSNNDNRPRIGSFVVR